MSDITIEISQDPSTVINVGPVEETLINSLTLNEGLINHSVTHISGGSDELFHNSLRVQGGQSGQYYHLTQNEYSNNLYKYDLPVYQTGNQEISGNKSFSNRPYINGTGVLLSGEFANTGYLVGYVPRIETGQFYAASNPSGFITGVDFSPYATIGYVTGASGSLQIQIDNLNGSTGSYVLNSETGIFITQSQTGLFYASNNPSGFITGIDLSSYATIDYVTGASGILQTQIDTLGGATGSYVLDGETGNFITQSQTGAFYASNNPSGFITGIDLSSYATTGYVAVANESLQVQINSLSAETGSYVLDSETGSFVTQSQTGAFYAANNPSGFITGVDLSSYATNSGVNDISGSLQNQINSLEGSTGDYVLKSQTGQFYPSYNPSGFITGVDLSNYSTISYSTGISGYLQNQISDLNNATGDYVLQSQTGQFYPSSNPSGFQPPTSSDSVIALSIYI